MRVIGIIGAMEEEVAELKRRMETQEETAIAGMAFVSGRLCGQKVVVVRSGIGKVNAAICAQILCDRYGVDVLLNTGVAGSLNAALDIGDIVISTDALQHDMDATGFGYAHGVIPQMDCSVFGADEALIRLAEQVCGEVNPEIHAVAGRVVSGDQFVSSSEKKAWIVANFGGLCTEMEGAAIAQTAYRNGIPYLILRAISDKADDSAHMDYAEFELQAIRNMVGLVCGLLERLD